VEEPIPLKKTRTKHSPAFKAKVALAALRDQESVAELARRYKVHANVVYKWKRQLLDNAAQSFETDPGEGGASEREGVLLKKIGELPVERDFCPTGSGAPDDTATSPDCTDGHAVAPAAVRAAGRDPVERVLRAGGPGRGGTGVDAPD
jgi:transposase